MSNWLPSLNALRAFAAVARHLSYQKAAAELSVTPAAVKQLVSKLEAAIGAPLIRRQGRGLALTPRGAAAVPDIVQAMDLMTTAVRKLRAEHEETRLLVSVEASFATAWLVPRLDRFRTKHPNVTVLVDSNQAIADLRRGDMDIGIRYGVPTEAGLIAHRLFQDEVFPACSPALFQGNKGSVDLSELADVPLIHWDIAHQPWARETSRWFTWARWLEREGHPHLSTTQGLHFNEYSQAVQAAIAGQGVLLASWPILREPFQSGVLVRPFRERQITDIGYELVTTDQTAQRPEVAAFVNWILSEAAQERE